MNIYVLSQLMEIIATILIGFSYISKSKRNIMLLCSFYCIFYGIHYLLLSAITGTVMIIVSFIRNVIFYFNAKKNRHNSKGILLTLLSISLIFGLISFQDKFSFISIIASSMSTYSIWQDDIRIYRLFSIPVSLCFIIYGIHINSVLAIFTEFILLIVEIIGILNLLTLKKREELY